MPTAAIRSLLVALTIPVSTLTVPTAPSADASTRAPVVVPNDNRRPAGTLADGTLTLALRAAHGTWRPEGLAGPALAIEALGEEGQPLAAPAPLIRVPEGTTLAVSVTNQLPTPLQVHGLCARDGTRCAPLEVPPGAMREVRFASGRAGTYHYWATAMGAPIPFREMAGAFVVDPAGAAATDRVLVITEWSNLTPEQLIGVLTADDSDAAFVRLQPDLGFMVNGLSWPATERLTYRLGETARWRVINLSSQPHPMHLHGFYFDVDSEGDGVADRPVDAAHRQRVVTHLLMPGRTMAMTWTPERAGNWLFHCHLMMHVSPMRRLGDAHHQAADHHRGHDPGLGMAGLVLGVTVEGPDDTDTDDIDTAPVPPARQLSLVMAPVPERDGQPAAAGFALHEGAAVDTPPSAPGPTVVLRRGEPVEITLDNRLGEATAIHWHGMELDSYYDGVHGFSGRGPKQTPMIAAGERFVVRFTPPRAGTFIYHTHLHDHRQLSSGLYGAMIVVEPGESFDPATDHVMVLGRSGIASGVLALPDDSTPVVLNGERAPRQVWRAGATHRLRLINITADDIFAVSLQTPAGPAQWTPVAKDGAPVPDAARVPGSARQILAVGETYDFEVAVSPRRQNLWLDVRTPLGKWQLQGELLVR